MKTGIRVWVVDDDDDFRGLFFEFLRSEVAVESVQEFCAAKAMLTALREQSCPDVILMDVQMPGMSGIEAIPFVHQLAPNTRVLMITAFFDETSRRQSFANGASNYFRKNVSPVRVVEAIQSALNQPVTTPEPCITNGRRPAAL